MTSYVVIIGALSASIDGDCTRSISRQLRCSYSVVAGPVQSVLVIIQIVTIVGISGSCRVKVRDRL